MSEDSLDEQGPLRWSFLPSTGEFSANTSEAVASENSLASLKFLVLHRPTHNSVAEASGVYPYSSHFLGRRRTWEVRVQVRFKSIPKGKICFGLEMEFQAGQRKSFAAQQVQWMLLKAIRSAVGDGFYHSAGDDPTTQEDLEPPCFILPLWAVDQFIVSEEGQEPDLSSDLQGLGHLRTDGARAYVDAMNSTMADVSCNKIYTFCFWCVSPFVDVINWELKGLWPGFRMDAAKLSGEPLLYVVAYDLADDPEKKCCRHVNSRKSYFFKVALWSALKPPSSKVLHATLASAGLGHEKASSVCKDLSETVMEKIELPKLMGNVYRNSDSAFTKRSDTCSPCAVMLTSPRQREGVEEECIAKRLRSLYRLITGTCFSCDFA